MVQNFQLSACAEMLWQDKPMHWRASRLKERGLGVGLWNWPEWDVDVLARTGATFTIMNGYLRGRLADPEGADLLMNSVREAVEIGKRLDVARYNLHGTGLGDLGLPIPVADTVAPGMWLRARDTLNRVCDFAENEGVTFTLENLNLRDHPGCPFNSTEEVLSLVSAVDRPEFRINLDLYHTQIGEGDVIRWIEACLPWIAELQVADNPGRFEPGTGELNWSRIADELKSIGYRGAVGLEAFAKSSAEEALDTFQAIFEG